MADQENNAKAPVTLEQLLQLKRQERPAPAFWDEFDRELRRRQLAAIVNVRPWHSRVGRRLFAGLRWLTPAGLAASAAVALGYFVMHRSEESMPTPIATATVVLDSEAQVLPLPEMHVLPTELARETVEMVAEQSPVLPPIEAQGFVQEFALSRASTVKYVSVTSPQTFSASESGESTEMVPTLTRGSTYHASGSSASGSF